MDEGRAAYAEFDGLDARGAQEALSDMFADEDGAAPPADSPLAEAHDSDADEIDGAEAEAAAAEARLLERRVEALIFASPEALSEADLLERVGEGAPLGVALTALAARYQGCGVELVCVAGRWRFQTAADVAAILETRRVEPRKLSRAALETLAIIAYHQPCTRADVEDVRGVAVSKGSLDQLLEIGWVRLKGRRRDAPGRPVLYATTPAFLEHFGLESVADLPGLSDLKAAGLLDARLPPGFAVPTPADAGPDEDEGEASGESAEFSQDFLSGDEAS